MKRIVPYTYVRRGDPGTGAFHLRYEMGEVRPPPPANPALISEYLIESFIIGMERRKTPSDRRSFPTIE